MLASISSEQAIEWKIFYSEHGFSADMDELRFAVLAASNWNVTAMSAGIKLDPPVSYKDFLPTTQPLEQTDFTDNELMELGASSGGLRIEPE